MSSDYKALCLSHHLVAVLDGGWRSPTVALSAVRNRAGSPLLLDHERCDVLIGRYSPLVQVGCPGIEVHGHRAHDDAEWIDVAWLRLAVVCADAAGPNDGLSGALADLPPCWRMPRLRRLRPAMGVW